MRMNICIIKKAHTAFLLLTILFLSFFHPQKLHANQFVELLIELETSVNFSAQTANWRSRRTSWLTDVRASANDVQRLKELIIEFETSVLYSAQYSDWPKRRSNWINRVRSARTIDELCGPLLELERSINFSAQTSSWPSRRPGWINAVNNINKHPSATIPSVSQQTESQKQINAFKHLWLRRPEFDKVQSFKEGFAPINKKGKWGFLDKKGNIAIAPIFDEVNSFSEKLAPVKVKGKWGYIDRTGKLVIPPKFEEANTFAEGLACVKTGTKYGFINRNGTMVIPPKYISARKFSEGLCAVIVDPEWQWWEYIDKAGKIAFEGKFADALDFSYGRAAVYTTGKWGYIDTHGNITIKPSFSKANNFVNSHAFVENEGGCFYIDIEGKQVSPKFPCEQIFGGELSNDLILFNEKGKYGYKNIQGTIIIPFEYDGALPFSDNIAITLKILNQNVKMEILFKDGSVLETIELFSHGGDSCSYTNFSEGIAQIGINNKWGFIKSPLAYIPLKEEMDNNICIGSIYSISGNEIIVSGDNIYKSVKMADRLCVFSGEKKIILNVYYPMLGSARCKIVSGSINDLQKNMKVYKCDTKK